MTTLEDEFDEAMMNVYQKARDKCDYKATKFLRMLQENGGIETAHRLLNGKDPQYGFTKLWECGCLDITVECLVLNPKYQEWFEERELETARRRLRQHDFNPNCCEQDSHQNNAN